MEILDNQTGLAAAKPNQELLQAEVVISKAVLKAMDLWSLTGADMHGILGPSPSFFTRLKKKTAYFKKGTKEWEIAVLFLRLFKSLDALSGGSDHYAKSWLRSHNNHLENTPLTLIQNIEGLIRVIRYLDAMRGKN